MLICKKCQREFDARAAARFVMAYSAISVDASNVDTGDLVVICRECLDTINPTGFHLLRAMGLIWIGRGNKGVARLD